MIYSILFHPVIVIDKHSSWCSGSFNLRINLFTFENLKDVIRSVTEKDDRIEYIIEKKLKPFG